MNTPVFPLVLRGGRVVDPETGLDGVADVGISGGQIAAVSEHRLTGERVIDVTGQVVAPGFIDLHSHAQGLLGQRLQALDGVTTALELEAGTLPVGATYRRAVAQGRVINFGYSASWALTRMALLDDVDLAEPMGTFLGNVSSPGWRKPADARTLDSILDRLDEGLAEGGIGIGLLLGYAPETGRDEYLRVARLARERGVPTFTHARSIGTESSGTESSGTGSSGTGSTGRGGPGTSLDGALEVIDAAAQTGAHMHLCHLNSTSDRMIDQIAEAIGAARRQGVRISTEAYPYGASSTAIGSPFFAPSELRRRGQSPRAITYLATGERVASAERLNELRAADPGGMVIFEWLDLDVAADLAILDRSLLLEDAAIASDALPAVRDGQLADPAAWPAPFGVRAHPRSAGTFARTFGWLVRQRGAMSVTDAIRRCSLLPATILQDAAPAMRRKGRVQAGCDADLVVFDPETITDRATYTQLRPSSGISHVLVGGVAVVSDGQLVDDVRPGRPVYGALAAPA